MARRKNFIAINKLLPLLAVLMLLVAGTAQAATVVGTVTDLSGPLLAHRANGVIMVLSQKSAVEQGDTLVTEKDTYARIKFLDNAEVTLQPNTQFRVDNYSYDEAKPENDSEIFSLIKGGLRSITGLLGKRNKERFGLNTPLATIGVRGTIFIVEYTPPTQIGMAAYQAASMASAGLDEFIAGGLPRASRYDAPLDFLPQQMLKPLQLAQNTLPPITGRAPGLYVQVLDGMIHLTNGGGTQNFTAGQFGFTPSFQQPPVILPTNPGMQFTPPPSFSTTTGATGATGAGKPGDVDCVVR